MKTIPQASRRRCPFDGCSATIGITRFGCIRHWYQLTKDEGNAVWDAYIAWRDGRIAADELRRRQEAVLAQWRGRHHVRTLFDGETQ